MSTATETDQTTTRRLANGLTLVMQPMPWLRTAAYTLWLPGGVSAELSVDQGDEDPGEHRRGLASLVAEMVQRGAGPYSSRQLVAAEDNLGIEGGISCSTSRVGFSAAMPAETLIPAFELLGHLVRRPHLPGDQLDDAKGMLMQEVLANEDEPTQRVMQRLRQRQYGLALGRPSLVTAESLQSLTIDDVREFYQTHYHAGDGILAVAGNIDVDSVGEAIEQQLGDFRVADAAGLPDSAPIDGAEHLPIDSHQCHIGFAFDSIPYGHPDYFIMRAGLGILSDGMSSRLFDRVREQRGLCYTVSAGSHSLPCAGSVLGYAGTTPPRAQETLDVTFAEIRGLIDDLQVQELERWKIRCQSNLIMQQESARSRTGSIATDQYLLGRVVPTAEIESIIESVTIDQVREYWTEHRPESLRLVVAGPEPLTLP